VYIVLCSLLCCGDCKQAHRMQNSKSRSDMNIWRTHFQLHLPPPLASHASSELPAMPYRSHTLGHTQLQCRTERVTATGTISEDTTNCDALVVMNSRPGRCGRRHMWPGEED